jgi:2-dehydropantoate 2-reductase
MNIVIVGAGALGSLLAGVFARQQKKLGHTVWVYDRLKSRSAKISQSGISAEGAAGSWTAQVNATAQVQDIKAADLLVLCVKSYATKEALEQTKHLLASGAKVLTLQNGMGNVEMIAEQAGADNVIAGITSIGATLVSDGVVKCAGKGETVFGRSDGTITVEMRDIRELFRQAGFDAKISKDVKSILWSKLVINCGINALSAVTRLANGKLLVFEGTRRIMREAVTEAVRVAKRKKIKLLYDDPLAKVEAVCEATEENQSSMLQDVLKKQKTEVDYINGVIVRLGQELGIAVPVNAFLLDLVRSIEGSYS